MKLAKTLKNSLLYIFTFALLTSFGKGQGQTPQPGKLVALQSMSVNPTTAPILKEIRNADGWPRLCCRVWISSVGCVGGA